MKITGRSNHNAAKLIEKYNDLAREALSNGDKILSENYLQHADHFTRILHERESYRKEKNYENGESKVETNEDSQEEITETSKESLNENSDISNENIKNQEVKKSAKSSIDIS